MSKYGSNSLKLELSDATDVLVDISHEVRTFNGIEIENLTTESHGFGDSWVENTWTGMKKLADITLEGFYDDASNTPVALYAAGALRRLKVTWGGGKSTEVPVMMAKFDRDPKLGDLTHYKIMLKNGGVPTEV